MNREEMENERKMLIILARTREDYLAMNTAMNNRMGLKANGENTKPRKNANPAMMLKKDRDGFLEISCAAEKQGKEIEELLQEKINLFPIYKHFLEPIKGVGSVSCGWIIGQFDIYKATTVSKMWQYAGMNPGMVRGKKMKKDKKGKKKIIVTDTMIRGDKLTPGFLSPYNTDLKRVLIGITGTNLTMKGINWIPCTENEYAVLPELHRKRKEKTINKKRYKDVPCRLSISSPYCQHYFDYKVRLMTSEKITKEVKIKGQKPENIMWKDAKQAHIDNAARRYMMKMFLKDLYAAWREIKGLPVRAPYQEAYLGHAHKAA